MAKRILNRREFLQTAGTAAATVVVAASGATTILASNGAWAMTLEALQPHEAEVLLAMTRRLYPHEMLGDVYYAEVVEAFDAKVKADPEHATPRMESRRVRRPRVGYQQGLLPLRFW